MRLFLRRLYMGLATVLRWKRMGFFIPYRYAGQITRSNSQQSYDALEAILEDRKNTFRELLSVMQDFSVDLKAIGNEPPPSPRWNQDWFPGLDAVAAYAMIRKHKPNRIVEVGSGHSTRFFARAVRDECLTTSITAIDPAPRADISELGVNVIRKTVQNAGLQAFSELESGDIVSIDSSHILMPGTDVDMVFNRVLPILPEGILVHIHDIFLPEPYPVSWDWRGYNEQLAVSPLMQGGSFDIIWASRYVRTRLNEALSTDLFDHIQPPEGGYESSLWLRKRSD